MRSGCTSAYRPSVHSPHGHTIVTNTTQIQRDKKLNRGAKRFVLDSREFQRLALKNVYLYLNLVRVSKRRDPM